MPRVFVGTSGWSYASRSGPFFPMGLAAKHQLEYYASQFETVELNGVFHRTPQPNPSSAGAMKPAGTSFSLGKRRAGPILFQLPPDFEADASRLGSFLTLLPDRRRYSFEFRHPSWHAPNILRMLGDRNIALCISDHHDAPAPWERTADFIYLRGHGPSGRYEGRYSRATLAAWRESIRTWQRDLCDVYAYFDNDQKSAAPKDALALLRLLAR